MFMFTVLDSYAEPSSAELGSAFCSASIAFFIIRDTHPPTSGRMGVHSILGGGFPYNETCSACKAESRAWFGRAYFGRAQ